MRNNDVYDIRDCALTSASELSGLSKRSHVRIHLVSSRGIARLDAPLCDHETRVHRETRAAESLWDARLDFRQDPLRMMKKLVEMGKETWRNREAVRTARHSSDLSRDAFTHPEDSSLRSRALARVGSERRDFVHPSPHQLRARVRMTSALLACAAPLLNVIRAHHRLRRGAHLVSDVAGAGN